jgi:hypothetical protein
MGEHGKTKRGGWRKWTPTQAKEALKAWQASGLPLETYARQRGVSGQRLRWWRERLGDSHQSAPNGGEARLVPAVLVGAPVPMASPVVTLHLPGGVALEVADATAVSPDWVAAVVGALARAG